MDERGPGTGEGGPAAARRTLRLDLQYDGTDFAGWQVQPGQRTVQGELERAASRVLEEAVDVVAAGRTDSGAHALGQVAHLRTTRTLAAESLRRGLNSLLDRDVRVVTVAEAPPGFHARHSARAKEYRYHIWHGRPVPPHLRRWVLGVAPALDIEAMDRAARRFVGTQDLSSFRSAHCTARTPVRTVYGSAVAGQGALAVFSIVGRGFLQHMVRIVAGTLVRIGRGAMTLDDLEALIAARDRRRAPPTAPAHGLWLVRVLYELEGAELGARPEPVLTSLDSAT